MGSKNPRDFREAEGLFEVPEPWMRSTQDVQRLMMGGVNPDGSLTPSAILALLKFHGSGPQQIGRELGISRTTVWEVIQGKRNTRYIQDAIAACLRMEADRVWGRR